MDSVETHRDVLIEFVHRTEGPVLELGMGDCSTPLLHELCGSRRLVSVENNREWFEKFNDLASDSHGLALVDSWDVADRDCTERWALAFIDQAPGESRAPSILALRDRADYIVVHDTEPAAAHLYPGVEDALSSFTYRKDYRNHTAYTTVVSMVKEP